MAALLVVAWSPDHATYRKMPCSGQETAAQPGLDAPATTFDRFPSLAQRVCVTLGWPPDRRVASAWAASRIMVGSTGSTPAARIMSHDFSLGTVDVALSPLERFEEFLQSRGKRVTQQRRI